jgi:hypothetical protein
MSRRISAAYFDVGDIVGKQIGKLNYRIVQQLSFNRTLITNVIAVRCILLEVDFTAIDSQRRNDILNVMPGLFH